MQNEYSIITASYPDKQSAMGIAKLLIEKRLAACVQMFPIQSVYIWKGEVCDEGEVMLFIKSKTALFPQISAVIKEHHTYEVPEITQIPITDGLPEYLNWIGDCTQQGV